MAEIVLSEEKNSISPRAVDWRVSIPVPELPSVRLALGVVAEILGLSPVKLKSPAIVSDP